MPDEATATAPQTTATAADGTATDVQTDSQVANRTEVDKLIEKISIIRNQIPTPKEAEDESAFDEAAEEYYAVNNARGKRMRR